MFENEEKTAETTVDEKETEVVGHADDDQEEQEVNEEEFTDEAGEESSEDKGNGEGEKTPLPMSKEQQSENARRRREAERQEELAKAREEAILDTLNHKNPYTGAEMKDRQDIQEYLVMREIEKKGGDPVSDYSTFQKEQARLQEKQVRQEAEQQAWFDKDREDFVSQHPEVNIAKLIQNDQFQRYASGKVGVMPLSEIYNGFMEMIEEYEGKAKKIAKQMVANKKASVGSLSNKSGTNKSTFFTREQVLAMSSEEKLANHDAIRASMPKW